MNSSDWEPLWIKTNSVEHATLYCYLKHQFHEYIPGPTDDCYDESYCHIKLFGVWDEGGNLINIPVRPQDENPENYEDYHDCPMIDEMYESLVDCTYDYWSDGSPWGDSPSIHVGLWEVQSANAEFTVVTPDPVYIKLFCPDGDQSIMEAYRAKHFKCDTHEQAKQLVLSTTGWHHGHIGRDRVTPSTIKSYVPRPQSYSLINHDISVDDVVF